MTYTQRIEGKPKSKGRPRFNRHTGTAYTPRTTAEYEAKIKREWAGPKVTGPIGVTVMYDKTGQTITVHELDPNSTTELPNVDVDNLVKATLDGLQGAAFDDDKQVFYLFVGKG